MEAAPFLLLLWLLWSCTCKQIYTHAHTHTVYPCAAGTCTHAHFTQPERDLKHAIKFPDLKLFHFFYVYSSRLFNFSIFPSFSEIQLTKRSHRFLRCATCYVHLYAYSLSEDGHSQTRPSRGHHLFVFVLRIFQMLAQRISFLQHSF